MGLQEGRLGSLEGEGGLSGGGTWCGPERAKVRSPGRGVTLQTVLQSVASVHGLGIQGLAGWWGLLCGQALVLPQPPPPLPPPPRPLHQRFQWLR